MICKLGLDEIPDELESYPRITYIECSYNNLVKFPSQVILNNLNALTELYLDYNNIEKLPPEIVFLQHLKVLSVNYNRLQELPPKIGQISTLEILSIQGNLGLNTLPPSICELKRLTRFSHDQREFVIPGDMIRDFFSNIFSPIEQRRKIAYLVKTYLELFDNFNVTFLPR